MLEGLLGRCWNPELQSKNDGSESFNESRGDVHEHKYHVLMCTTDDTLTDNLSPASQLASFDWLSLTQLRLVGVL